MIPILLKVRIIASLASRKNTELAIASDYLKKWEVYEKNIFNRCPMTGSY